MADRSTARSIDEYIAEFPPGAQQLLRQMRELIRASAPGAVETISYAIPTFDLNGRHLAHFAGFKNHIGFYPAASGIEHFKEEIAQYKNAKGSVQFPLDRPLPGDLIRRIVEFRVGEVGGNEEHRAFALWAAECAEHVLRYFEDSSTGDDRPRKAIEAARAWARGEIMTSEARKAALAAHAAAEGAPSAAARAAGHAAATAHVAGHAKGAALYAVKAAAAAGAGADAAAAAEQEWQRDLLRKRLRALV